MVKEDLTIRIIKSALCDKLIDKPELCSQFNIQNLLIHLNQNKKLNASNSLLIFIIILVIGLLFLAFIILVIRKALKKRIGDEVNFKIQQHISEYMRLKNEKW